MVAALLSLGGTASAQPLVVDPDFAPVLISRAGLNTVTLHPLASGRMLAAGRFTYVEGVHVAGLARLEASGARDATFTFAGPALDPQDMVIPLADGRFLVKRWDRASAGQPWRVWLERFLADGAFDTGYAGLECDPRDALLAPDGSVIIAGSFAEIAGEVREGLARLAADGTLDSSFAPTLAGPKSVVTSVVLGSDGAVTVTGYRAGIGAVGIFMRFRADGTQDATFAPDAAQFPYDKWPRVLAALPGGKVLVTSRDTPLVRLAADGAVDAAFAPQLPAAHAATKAVALSDGRILVEVAPDLGGSLGSAAALLVLAEDGALQRDLTASFPADTIVQLAGMTADGAVLLRHGKWVSNPGYGYTISGIARVALDGTIVAQLAIDLGIEGWVSGMIASDDGSVTISGAFASVNGTPRPGIARLLASGAVDPAFTPQGAATLALTQPDGRLLVYVAAAQTQPSPSSDLECRVRRLLADGSLDPSLPIDSPLASDDFELLGFDRNGRVIATKRVPGESQRTQRLQFFNTNGTLAATLPTRFSGSFVVLHAEDPTPAVIAPPQPTNFISGVHDFEDGGLLVTGEFDHVNGQPWPKLVRLKADGSIDTDYRPLGYPGEILSDARLLGGGRALVTFWDQLRSGFRTRSARLLADGTEDPTFRPEPFVPLFGDTTFDGAATSVRVLPDGRIVVAGRFSAVDGVPRTGLARLLPAPVPGITVPPISTTVTAGRGTHFRVAAGDPGNATYQWQFNGVDIAGETRALLVLDEVAPQQAGEYRAVVRIGGQTFVSEPATLTVAPNTARLANFSARSRVEPGRPPQIAGFVATGSAPREVLLRAVGPSLNFVTGFQLQGLRNPRACLFRGTEPIADGTRWPYPAEAGVRSERVRAFPLEAWRYFASDSDSVIAADVPGGLYTVQTTAGDDRAGISLFEFYDAATHATPGYVRNVSLRGRTAPGHETMIGGFVVAGEGPITLLMRVVGSELADFGVPGPLADPRLTLFSGSRSIGSNDDWTRPLHAAPLTIAEAVTRTGAFPLDPDGRSAALVARFERGAYTVHATGAGDTSGEVLLEIYVVDD